MIYKTFEQWKSGNVLEHGVPRTEHYTEDQLDLVEMGWNYGYDAGRAVEQALDKKAENAKELGLDYEPDLQAELEATNRQVEILSDALAESRREVDALVALARADEREACAKVCDRMAARCNDIRAAALESAAENIRARGNT
jgi:hypothetical protein